MLTAQMKDVESIMDKEVIKVYIQFTYFFLIKGFDEKIYILDNDFFNYNSAESDINEFVSKALKNEKFTIFRKNLTKSMLTQSMKFNLYNENISIGFRFNHIF